MSAIEEIRTHQKNWFSVIKPYLLKTNLNVGSGHGFFSQYANEEGFQMTSLEIDLPSDVVNKEEVIIYDGKQMPFADKSFEASLAMYVLHHSPSPELLLKEMKRVSSRRIIIVEELYHTIFGKVRLSLLDRSVNTKVNLKSKIYWNSYMTKDRFSKLIETNGWKIVHYSATPKKGFDEIMCVADRVN